MINFTLPTNATLTITVISAGEPSYYSLAAAAQISGVHPDMLRYYLRLKLIEAQRGAWDDELYFDRDALEELRRLGHYRRHLGVSRRALPLICKLRRESELQNIELGFLRCP